MLFESKNRKRFQMLWAGLSALIVVSMILLYTLRF